MKLHDLVEDHNKVQVIITVKGKGEGLRLPFRNSLIASTVLGRLLVLTIKDRTSL